MDGLEGNLAAAQNELRLSEGTLIAVREEDAKVNSEIQKLQGERSQLSAEEERVRSEIAILAREKAAFLRESLGAEDSEEGLRAKIQEKEAEIKAFTKRFEEMKRTSDGSEAEYDITRKTQAALEIELQKLREKSYQSQLTLQHIKEKIEKLRRKLEIKDIEKAQVLYTLKSKEATLIEEIRRAKDDLAKSLEDAKSRLQQAKEREITLSKELEIARKTAPVGKKLTQKPTQIVFSEPTLEKLQALKDELQTKQNELTELQAISDRQISAKMTAMLLLVVGFGIGAMLYPIGSSFFD